MKWQCKAVLFTIILNHQIRIIKTGTIEFNIKVFIVAIADKNTFLVKKRISIIVIDINITLAMQLLQGPKNLVT